MEEKPHQEYTGAILLEDGAMVGLIPTADNKRLVLHVMNSPFDFSTITLHPADILALIQALTSELNNLEPITHIV